MAFDDDKSTNNDDDATARDFIAGVTLGHQMESEKQEKEAEKKEEYKASED